MNKVNLIKGQSLLIVGPQGSGKTLLAEKIANDSNGVYRHEHYELSETQMKNQVIGNPHLSFIFTAHEVSNDLLTNGSRRFVVKTISELLNSQIYLWSVAGQVKVFGKS